MLDKLVGVLPPHLKDGIDFFYTKNKILVGTYCIFSAQKLSSLNSIVPNAAKIIDVEITEMIKKSINHARNLSVHFARIISVDESESLIILLE